MHQSEAAGLWGIELDDAAGAPICWWATSCMIGVATEPPTFLDITELTMVFPAVLHDGPHTTGFRFDPNNLEANHWSWQKFLVRACMPAPVPKGRVDTPAHVEAMNQCKNDIMQTGVAKVHGREHMY